MPDPRALKILFNTYWSPAGWRSAGNPNWQPETPVDDLAYAVRAGVMFAPARYPHDETVARIQQLRNQIQPSQVGAAFAASLSTNQPALRSALGTYAVALHLPMNRYSPGGGRRCAVCGGYDTREEQDLNILNFERHKSGGVRHEDPVYIAFDLERFRAEAGSQPTAADQGSLADVLSAAGSMPANAKLADLVRAIAPMVPGNKDQRRTLIAILGFAGVLLSPIVRGSFGPLRLQPIARKRPGTKTTGRTPSAGGVVGCLSTMKPCPSGSAAAVPLPGARAERLPAQPGRRPHQTGGRPRQTRGRPRQIG